MKETWKDIKGYEGMYQVSNCGNVKSLDRHVIGNKGYLHLISGKFLPGAKHQPKRSRNGKSYESTAYMRITLSKNGNQKTFMVHRLVADAFIPNEKSKPFINHKDGNGLNNNVANLEWCTASENTKHSYTLPGRKKMVKGFEHNNTKLSDNEVVIIRSMLSDGIYTQKMIGRIFGIARTTVSSIKNNRLYNHVKLKHER